MADNPEITNYLYPPKRRSRLWELLAWGAFVIGALGGIIGAGAVPAVTRDSDVLKRTPIEECTFIRTVFASPRQFAFSNQYVDNGMIERGTVVTNRTHCALLKSAFGPNLKLKGGDSIPVQQRDWVRDLLRRFVVILLGCLVGAVAALPSIAMFHLVKTLEEIRDKRVA